MIKFEHTSGPVQSFLSLSNYVTRPFTFSLQAVPFQSVVYPSLTSTDRVLEVLCTYSSGRFDFIFGMLPPLFLPFPNVSYNCRLLLSYSILYCLYGFLLTLFCVHHEALAFLP